MSDSDFYAFYIFIKFNLINELNKTPRKAWQNTYMVSQIFSLKHVNFLFGPANVKIKTTFELRYIKLYNKIEYW